MMLGRSEEALRAARDMLRKIPEDFAVAAAPFVDPLASIEISALMRFGRWEEILAHPRPAEHLPVTIGMWHFARGSALAALVAAGRFPEADAVYRADLERLPDNGWALYGLARSLKEQNSPEAAEVEARFQKAWAHADTQLTATCLCVSAAVDGNPEN